MTTRGVPEQCVLLVGGLGTRPDESMRMCLTPLLDINEAPLLDVLVGRLKRFGFRRVLLLAGDRGERFVDYVRQRAEDASVSFELVMGSTSLGTAGALRLAADRLDPCFLLMHGHALFDFNWLDLVPFAASRPCLLAMGLREEPDTSRFGVVHVDRDRVTGFRDRGGPAPGLVSGGVFLAARDIVAFLPETGSLERDVFPALAARGHVRARSYAGFFIDIGIPAAYARAAELLRQNDARAAVFLDRDGVLNSDRGYVHRIDQFEWMPGAIDAVKLINDSGHYAFLVTNQAGVARGLYAEEEVAILHDHIQATLRRSGAHLDDIRYCPFHPDGTVARYARASESRKPEPGMILDLARHWPVDLANSFLVGDKPSDLVAAQRAGIRGHLFAGGNLLDFVAPLLAAFV